MTTSATTKTGLTTEDVLVLTHGVRLAHGWRRDYTRRAQITRIVCGHELKVFAAKAKTRNIEWELRPLAGTFVSDHGAAPSWAQAIEQIEKVFLQKLLDGVKELRESLGDAGPS